MYRLQQHLAITPHECSVFIGLAVLLGAGLVLRHVQSQAQPLPADYYAAQDQRFEERSAAPLLPESAAETAPLPVPASDAATDSTEQDEAPEAVPQAASTSSVRLPRMNLNLATAAQLERLPRIGPALSGRIVAYRDAHGPFRQVSDLVEVRGIGEKTLAKVKPYVFVEGASAP
jgi:competence protein ComEA